MEAPDKWNAVLPLALNPQWLKENLPRYLWRKDESPGKIDALEIIAKQFHDGQKARQLYHNLLTLHTARSRPKHGRLSPDTPHELPPPLHCLRPLACDETNGVVFIENIPGAQLDQLKYADSF